MKTNTTRSDALFSEAKAIIPGGVNSPVRAFGSVGTGPRFMASAKGAVIVDADGNEYIDYVCSWGPMILGHNDPEVVAAVQKAALDGMSFGAPCEYEVAIARVITRIAPVEMVRMVNSGTEAVMSALRLARGFTGRDKVIKFAGCYHGHSDGMLVKAGSGALTAGIPDSAGVTPGTAADTLTAVYNDLDSVQSLFESNPESVAALIVEPVAANIGLVLPRPGFLEGLRELCDEYGALLIFDEVITGFRLALGGAQEYYGIQADLATYGKIIGGGMPVGAYAGRKEIMEHVAPLGHVYQAGTLSGNPVAMAAGLAQLSKLERDPGVYARLEAATASLADGLRGAVRKTGRQAQVNQIGSLCCSYFSPVPVEDYKTAKQSDVAAFSRYFAAMLERGVYLAPSQFETMFVSDAHTPEMLARTAEAAEAALGGLR